MGMVAAPEAPATPRIDPPAFERKAKTSVVYAERPIRKRTIGNLYAALNDGVHTSWDVCGREVILPTLDEQEMLFT